MVEIVVIIVTSKVNDLATLRFSEILGIVVEDAPCQSLSRNDSGPRPTYCSLGKSRRLKALLQPLVVIESRSVGLAISHLKHPSQ